MEPYTKVPNVFLDNLNKSTMPADIVFLVICRKTIGWGKEWDTISYRQMSKLTGMAISTVQGAISRLLKLGWIAVRSAGKQRYEYKVTVPGNSTVDTTTTVPANNTVPYREMVQLDPKPYRETVQQKKEEKEKRNIYSAVNNIPYKKIVSYLNEKAKTNFRATTEDTKKHIRARFNEDFKEADFYKVIDVKCDEWAADPKMVMYLRPKTLFGTKFESYLNQYKEKPVNENEAFLNKFRAELRADQEGENANP